MPSFEWIGKERITQIFNYIKGEFDKLGTAAKKGVDESITFESQSTNLPTTKAVNGAIGAIKSALSTYLPLSGGQITGSLNVTNSLNSAAIYENSVALDQKYSLVSEAGYDLGLSIDTKTYIMTLELKNKAGVVISTKTLDFPIESMVVNASYKDGKLTLTLQSGSTLDVDISALVGGLVNDSFTIAGIDMKDDITAAELKTALGIPNTYAPTDAQKNVQADWNVTDTNSDAFIKNKPTELPAKGGTSDYVSDMGAPSSGRKVKFKYLSDSLATSQINALVGYSTDGLSSQTGTAAPVSKNAVREWLDSIDKADKVGNEDSGYFDGWDISGMKDSINDIESDISDLDDEIDEINNNLANLNKSVVFNINVDDTSKSLDECLNIVKNQLPDTGAAMGYIRPTTSNQFYIMHKYNNYVMVMTCSWSGTTNPVWRSL